MVSTKKGRPGEKAAAQRYSQTQTTPSIVSSEDVALLFRYAMQAHGLDPHQRIVSGQFVRFAGAGKKGANRAGWAILFDDLQGGVFGDYSTGLRVVWRAPNHRPPTDCELRMRAEASKRARSERERDLSESRAKAAALAVEIWRESVPASRDHGYLVDKCVRPLGLRERAGSLVVPVSDIGGRLQSIQFIDRHGVKQFLSRGQISGGMCLIGELNAENSVYVTEGWATAATLYDQLKGCVVAAFNAGNLEAVAMAIRSSFPSADIVIAGDNDRHTSGNPGKTAAESAARASKARVMIPEFNDGESGSDWNDWHCNRLRGEVA